jgi:putative transposase
MESLYKELGITRQAIWQYNRRELGNKVIVNEVIDLVKKQRKKHPKMGSRILFHTITNVEGRELKIGINKFEKIVSEAGLTAGKYKIRSPKTSDGLGRNNYPNLTKGLVLSNINQLVVGDITYYQLEDRFYYIFTLKDVYSQRILGLLPAITMESKNANECLESAITLRGQEQLMGCIHHTDNGSQYNANSYIKRLQENGMQISRADNCQENGSAEQLNHIIKNMYLDEWKINTFKELKKACIELTLILNEHRAIKSLGNVSSIQFETIIKNITEEERPKIKLYDFKN